MSTKMSISVDDLSQESMSVKLYRLRCRHGLSRAKFAKQIGCSSSTVKNWEYGNCQPSCILLEKIIQFYGLDYAFFIENIKEANK
jgi:transcriptional regulator with XRE-family HTH domain